MKKTFIPFVAALAAVPFCISAAEVPVTSLSGPKSKVDVSVDLEPSQSNPPLNSVNGKYSGTNDLKANLSVKPDGGLDVGGSYGGFNCSVASQSNGYNSTSLGVHSSEKKVGAQITLGNDGTTKLGGDYSGIGASVTSHPEGYNSYFIGGDWHW